MKQTSSHVTYRPDIDGLRAAAIVSVIGFHAFPAWVPGGFVGVDVFFVISGFLITSILLSDLNNRTFSIAAFYGRRIRRIFPSLILVLTASMAAGLIFLWPGELLHLAKDAIYGTAFILNFLLEKDSGYFAEKSEDIPLLHLWSLAIEEQFYIFWPLLLALIVKTKNFTRALIATFFIASFAYSVWLGIRDPLLDFYSPLSRFWELLAGALAAWHQFKHPQFTVTQTSSPYVSALGLGLIVVSDFVFQKSLPFPSFYALLPVLGAVLIIIASPSSFINRRVLACPPIVGIGLISYPLYLWHWPLLSFAQIIDGEASSRTLRTAVVILSFGLAALTYHFVEKPLRAKPIGKKMIGLLLSAMILTAALSGLILQNHGYPERFAIEGAKTDTLDSDILITQWQQDVRFDMCHLQDNALSMQAPLCFDARRPLVWLWGDSHAAALYPGLKTLQRNGLFGLTQTTEAGCPPLFDLGPFKARPNCSFINQRILLQMGDTQPDIVILASAWLRFDYSIKANDLMHHLLKTIDRIHSVSPKSHIIVVGPVPRWLSPLPAIYRRSLIFDHKAPSVRLSERLDKSFFALDKDMAAQVSLSGSDYLSPIAELCNPLGCLTRLGPNFDTLTYVDEEHLSPLASTFVINGFASHILGDLKAIAK